MFKKENGITLVALVVTIIILLILAGVTLTIALSDNGLFGYSKNAVERYEQASDQEVTSLNDVTNIMMNLISNLTTGK